MANVTIYHNPRCSKSRQTLELLKSKGIEPTVVEYLSDTPTAEQLEAIINKLGIEPIDLMRRNEAPFKELGLAEKASDRKALIAAMVKHPILIERPIVVKGNRARLGRPPEQVLEIL